MAAAVMEAAASEVVARVVECTARAAVWMEALSVVAEKVVVGRVQASSEAAK